MTDLVIIGAGPYGLSVAAHAAAARINYKIFGVPMDTWRARMPEGMLLRSPSFASDISDPAGRYSLRNYWRATDRPATTLRDPIPRETYCAYGQWFIEKTGIDVDTAVLKRLGRDGDAFVLDFDSGEQLRASRVVLAVGLTHYAYVPPLLHDVSAIHSSELTRPRDFAGRAVLVVGGGQSSFESAALLHEAGANVRVIARRSALEWTQEPLPERRSLVENLRVPEGGLCDGWGCWGYEHLAPLFHRLPPSRRLKLVQTRFGPMVAWWLRDRLTPIPVELGAVLTSRRVEHEAADVDRVIAATGYRVDLDRLEFLDDETRRSMRTFAGAPILNTHFESSIPGLFFVGATSAMSFGPLTRFVAGAKFTARRVVR